jgi:hypothetical protein
MVIVQAIIACSKWAENSGNRMSHWTGENAVRAPYPEAPGKASGAADIVGERRRMLKKLGRFAVVSAPAVTLLLAANLKPKTAVAAS